MKKNLRSIDPTAARWGAALGYAVVDGWHLIRSVVDTEREAQAVIGGRSGWRIYAILASEVSRAA